MLIRKGAKGPKVEEIQRMVGLTGNDVDGDFGPTTHKAVVAWQKANNLAADGIVGPNTWAAMALITTDQEENAYTTENGTLITRHYLDEDEYVHQLTKKDTLFLHHTAGWDNPYNVIGWWNKDGDGKRHRVGTEFVIGGQSVRGNRDDFDGQILQAIPTGNFAYHLGIGNAAMDKHSVGIEVCNFGWVKDGRTYVGTKVVPEQVVTLAQPFRGHRQWQRYSDDQLTALQGLIEHIANRDSINIREGLVQEVKAKGAAGFEFNAAARKGLVKGMWTHTSVRKDKNDMFPQQELLDMLVSL